LDPSVGPADAFSCSSPPVMVLPTNTTEHPGVAVDMSSMDVILFNGAYNQHLALASPTTLHIDSHGGFSVLIKVLPRPIVHDMTVLSLRDSSSGARILMRMLGVYRTFQFTISNASGQSYTAASITPAPAADHHTLYFYFWPGIPDIAIWRLNALGNWEVDILDGDRSAIISNVRTHLGKQFSSGSLKCTVDVVIVCGAATTYFYLHRLEAA
jgi:hypothetical protein